MHTLQTESRPGGRSYYWVSPCSTQSAGNSADIQRREERRSAFPTHIPRLLQFRENPCRVPLSSQLREFYGISIVFVVHSFDPIRSLDLNESRPGGRSYYWVSHCSTQFAGNSADIQRREERRSAFPTHIPRQLQFRENPCRVPLSSQLREFYGISIVFVVHSFDPIRSLDLNESRPGGRSYYWVSHCSTQFAGNSSVIALFLRDVPVKHL